jgi:hypothetical protein
MTHVRTSIPLILGAGGGGRGRGICRGRGCCGRPSRATGALSPVLKEVAHGLRCLHRRILCRRGDLAGSDP